MPKSPAAPSTPGSAVDNKAVGRPGSTGSNKPRFGLGEVFKVNSLLACKGEGESRRFLVRWQPPYNTPKDDSDEPACDVSQDLIETFDAAPLYKAPWSGWLCLVESILERRDVDR